MSDLRRACTSFTHGVLYVPTTHVMVMRITVVEPIDKG